MKLAKGTVYSKALAIFLAASLLLLGAVASLTQLVILREFNQTENREMKSTLQRFALMLARNVQPIEIAVRDWSRLPGLRDFVSGKAVDFDYGPLVPEMLENLDADFLAIYGSDGNLRRLICANGADQETLLRGDGLSVSLSQIQPAKNAEGDGGQSGFTLINGELANLAIHPIPLDNARGNSGLLVCGKIFRTGSWRFLESLFSAEIKFHEFGNIQSEDSRGKEMIDLLNKEEIIVDVEKSDLITGYRVIRGLNGLPLGFASITQERPLRQDGLHAISIFLVAITLAGGALVFLVWFLLDRTILRRISELTNKLDQEKKLGRLPVKLDFPGSDELSTLARSIEDLAVLLERTQSQYRSVVEEQTEIICRFDESMHVVFANQVFNRTFGVSSASGEGVTLYDALPEGAYNLISLRYRDLTVAKPLVAFAQEIVLASGQAVWLRNSLRGNFSPTGDRLGGQWVAADITTQIEAQRRMLESERRFRRLFETSSDGILLVDGETLVVSDINTSLCRQLFLAGSDVLGRRISEIVAFEPCLAAVEQSRSHGVLSRSSAEKNEFRLIREDNSALYMELHCSTYLVEDKSYMQLNFRNVSERVESDRQLRRLSAKLLRMQDEERRRIARELHDSTAQNLSALEMNMSLLEPMVVSLDARAVRIVAETREIARECSRELRNISYLLHPPLIDEVGLVFALRWFIDGFNQRTGIQTDVEISPDFPRLAGDVELPLFRVLQEAMTNIYRHAGATRAQVTLRSDAEEVTLRIKDDGAGFGGRTSDGESADLVRGVGLAGMRERLAVLGGRLDVTTTPEGVTVLAQIAIQSIHVERGH